MYSIGDTVVKANVGVCRITEIGKPDFRPAAESRLYYFIVPLSDPKSRIYVPVEPEPDSLRPVMSEAEALSLIHKMPDIAPMSIENWKLRGQEYNEVLKKNRPEQLAAVIKALYLRECERSAQGRKTTTTDKSIFQTAEKLLYSELAYALNREREEITGFIRSAVDEK